MKPGVYFIRLGFDDKQPIKIGYSVNPLQRLHSLCNYRRKSGVLLAHMRGPPMLEQEVHDKLAEWAVGHEMFIYDGLVKTLIEKHAVSNVTKLYERRNPGHSRRKVPLATMTPERIKRVGEMLNSGMTGPQVAKKLKVSTASVYAFWKQAGNGLFIRKPKVAKKRRRPRSDRNAA